MTFVIAMAADRDTPFDALVIEDPLFLEHHPLGPHPERPERLTAARRAIERTEGELAWSRLVPRDAEREELLRVHTANYLERLDQSAGHSMMFDEDTYVAPLSVAAARRAAGASAVLVDALLQQTPRRFGVALLRPPGHHARPSSAMGFCLLNNVAVAAAHARARGVERVLVLDWDVHHGNGTQEIFYSDPNVLFISLHQFPYYPGTGDADEVGRGSGRGYTVNVPLSAGATDSVYEAAFERLVCPIIEQYRPGMTLVSAGFDAHVRDPLGGMSVTDAGYFAIATRLIKALPPEHPLGVLLEGGYDLTGLEEALLATVVALGGRRAQRRSETEAPPPMEPIHERDLERAEMALRPYWYLG